MDTAIAKRKRLRLTVGLAVLGFVIAAAISAYFELTDPPTISSGALVCLVILCPASLVSLLFIDVESTGAITILWMVIAVMNSALYATIGAFIGRLCWKSDSYAAM